MDSLVQMIVDGLSSSASRELIIFLVSMMPILELRGGILAASLLQVDWLRAMVICFVGTILPIPFILLFIRQILEWLKNTRLVKLVHKLEEKAERKSKSIEKYKTLGLFLFVAIPLPGTGAWTGALVAALIGMRFKHAMTSIVLGTLTADVIMVILSYGLLGAIL
ncbi:COG2426 family protein [Anaeromassilibacillus senegalensis]|uniref:COG2426 family protein n=1 Tax=Anaeromassilibacillus senegalensis TaxID=1673717 RepID=UPI000680E241|nr:small multi-drug export protein [Anaeromassilibacillus senegalensis]